MKTSSQLVKNASVGANLLMSDGKPYKVLAKSVTAGSTSYRLSGPDSTLVVTAEKLASMQPVHPHIAKFARLIRLAYNEDFSFYINQAIQEAGYKPDPKMRWAAWLNSVFVPRIYKWTKDVDLIDEGIHAMLIHELYEKRILDSNSKFSHFIPNHSSASFADKPVDEQVTAYLSMIFKGRVEWVRDYILKNEFGATTRYGEKGFALPDSLVQGDTEGEGSTIDYGEVGASGNGATNKELEDREGLEEVGRFCEAFKRAVRRMGRLHESTRKLLCLITDLVARGDSREDIKEEVLSSGISSPRGEELNAESWKSIIKQWVALIRKFAEISEFADTPIGKLIAAQAPALAKAAGKVAEEHQVVEACQAHNIPGKTVFCSECGKTFRNPAKKADSSTNPVTPNPPAVNPNVAQQQQMSQQEQAAGTQAPIESDMAKPGAPVDPNAQEMAQNPQTQLGQPDQTQKKTIPPEIPGENHMASKKLNRSK